MIRLVLAALLLLVVATPVAGAEWSYTGCVAAVSVEDAGTCAPGGPVAGASGVAVAADGLSVAVAGALNGGVALLARDPASGALALRACVTDNGTDGRDGTDGACIDGDALIGPTFVAFDGPQLFRSQHAQRLGDHVRPGLGRAGAVPEGQRTGPLRGLGPRARRRPRTRLHPRPPLCRRCRRGCRRGASPRAGRARPGRLRSRPTAATVTALTRLACSAPARWPSRPTAARSTSSPPTARAWPRSPAIRSPVRCVRLAACSRACRAAGRARACVPWLAPTRSWPSVRTSTSPGATAPRSRGCGVGRTAACASRRAAASGAAAPPTARFSACGLWPRPPAGDRLVAASPDGLQLYARDAATGAADPRGLRPRPAAPPHALRGRAPDRPCPHGHRHARRPRRARGDRQRAGRVPARGGAMSRHTASAALWLALVCVLALADVASAQVRLGHSAGCGRRVASARDLRTRLRPARRLGGRAQPGRDAGLRLRRDLVRRGDAGAGRRGRAALDRLCQR